MSSSNINFYTNLSSIYWKPVKFSIVGEQIKLKEIPILTKNGMFFNLTECLNDCTDYSSNHNAGMFLTNLKKSRDFLEDNIPQKDSNYLLTIKTPVGTFQNNASSTVVKIEDNGLYFSMVTSSDTRFNDKDIFTFIFYPEGHVMIKNYMDYYLTSKSENMINGVEFQPKIFPENQAQQFDYFLGENSISLFEIDDRNEVARFRNAVMYTDQTNGKYVLKNISNLLSASTFPIEASFNLLCYDKNLDTYDNNIKNSFLAKYKITPLDEKNSLVLDEEITSQEYSQNYIGIFPNENLTDGDVFVEYPLAIHSLKNYQTPEYNYSFGATLLDDQRGVRRIYEQIFSGTNQTGGLQNLFLGFVSNTLEYKFKPDNLTEFYFPPTAERIHIMDSGLIEDGAIAGEIPYNSDRLSVKLQNYKELIPDSNQPKSIPIESNTWLCSWLSGSLNGDKVWMDRYYNAAYFTMDQALSTKALVYHDKLDPSLNYTFDVPSQMYLEPGVLYNFFHIGQNNRIQFLNYLSASSILQITNWTSDQLKYDYKEDYYGIVYNNKETNLKDYYIQLDGSNHVLFPATTELLEPYNLTVSMWINVNDWNYIEGSQIFGNYYDSGYGLINESSITTPIITMMDSLNNTAYNLNYRFSLLNVADLNTIYTDLENQNTPENSYIQRLNDFNYWIFDKKNIQGIKFNIDNQSTVKVGFDQTDLLTQNLNSLDEVSQIEIDSNENVYFFDVKTKRCVVFNTYGVFIENLTLDENTNRIEINSKGEILSLFGTHSVLDSEDNVWEIVGGNLYKNKKVFGNIGFVEYLTCDAQNNIWILHGQDSLTKIDTKLNKIASGFPKRIGSTSSLPEDPCYDYTKRRRYLNFVRVPRDINSNACEATLKATEDRLILLDTLDSQLYTLNDYGDLVIKLNLKGLNVGKDVKILADGDFTGYNFLRRYSSSNKKLSWKVNIANPNGKNKNLLILPIKTENLSSGWHNFILNFNSSEGYAKTYIDNVLSHEEFFEPKKYQIYYKYRTSLLLGAETVRNTTLNDIIDINDGYKFVGRISDLRLYNKSLTVGEQEQLYYSSSFVAQDRDLSWNMLVGERSYIEEIAHWLKLQTPGSKSKYYNINLYNFNVNDDIKMIIEESIRENISKISPANTELYKINWL